MNKRVKRILWKVFVIQACLLPLSGFIFSFHSGEFEKVLTQAKNDTIREKLIIFRQGGLEREVDTSNYDVERIIEYAKTFLGTPHKMAGTTKAGIDCSGLVQVCHAKFGVFLPHSSHEQARYGAIVGDRSGIRRGDLLFFYNSYNSANFITHTGIYLGNDEYIHASDSKGVIISSIKQGYWNDRYLFATRFSR